MWLDFNGASIPCLLPLKAQGLYRKGMEAVDVHSETVLAGDAKSISLWGESSHEVGG